jgi:hypothetical protein
MSIAYLSKTASAGMPSGCAGKRLLASFGLRLDFPFTLLFACLPLALSLSWLASGVPRAWAEADDKGALVKRPITLRCSSATVDRFCRRLSQTAGLRVVANAPTDLRISVEWQAKPLTSALRELGAKYEMLWRFGSGDLLVLLFNPPADSNERGFFSGVWEEPPNDDLILCCLDLIRSLSDAQLAVIAKPGQASGLPVTSLSDYQFQRYAKIDNSFASDLAKGEAVRRRLVLSLDIHPRIEIHDGSLSYGFSWDTGEAWRKQGEAATAPAPGHKPSLPDSTAKVTIREPSLITLENAMGMLAQAAGSELTVDDRMAKLKVYISPGEYRAGELAGWLAESWFLTLHSPASLEFEEVPPWLGSGIYRRTFCAQVGRLVAAGVSETAEPYRPFPSSILVSPNPSPYRCPLVKLTETQRKFITGKLAKVVPAEKLSADAVVEITPSIEVMSLLMKKVWQEPESMSSVEM